MVNKYKKGGHRPLTREERLQAEKERRAERKRKYPELSRVFKIGMVVMVLYMIAWPASSALQLPISFYMSLFMYLLIGFLLWRRPNLVVAVITRNKSDLKDDDPQILKAVKRLRQAGVALIILGVFLIGLSTYNMVQNLASSDAGFAPNSQNGVVTESVEGESGL